MTAVEFLIEQFKIYLPSIHQKGLQDAFEQANNLFEQQMIDAYDRGYDIGAYGDVCEPEKYFNETYKSDEI